MISVLLVDGPDPGAPGHPQPLEPSDEIRVVAAEAADGAQAVELIPQTKPDVVLLDLRMPAWTASTCFARWPRRPATALDHHPDHLH